MSEEDINEIIDLCYKSFHEHMEHARHLETQRYQFLGFNIIFLGIIIERICSKSDYCEKCFCILNIFLFIWISVSFTLTFIWNMNFEKHRKFANMYSDVINDYYHRNESESKKTIERILIQTDYFTGNNKSDIKRPYMFKTRTIFISIYIYIFVFMTCFLLCINGIKFCYGLICCGLIIVILAHSLTYWYEKRRLRQYDEQQNSVYENIIALLDIIPRR